MNYKGFSDTGKFYKGNLHSHTTNSDGLLPPASYCNMYKDKGYSFVCLSDHSKYTDWRNELDTDTFITLPGGEYAVILVNDEAGIKAKAPEFSKYFVKCHHFLGILGTREMVENATGKPFENNEEMRSKRVAVEWDGAKEAQEMTDLLRSKGMFVIYNHPRWSKVREDEFINTEGLTAIEVYNHASEIGHETGIDTVRWDSMLREDKKVNCTAADDSHFKWNYDGFGGWIMVKSDKLEHEEIVKNIINGNYYSSMGPEIYDWGIRDGVAYIDCSEVEKISFVAGKNILGIGASYCDKPHEDAMKHAEYRIRGTETYLRIEITDKYGRKAWTNPVYFDEINK